MERQDARRLADWMLFAALAAVGFALALVVAYSYGAAQTAPPPNFLLVENTYKVLLPFLLTTVAAGAAGVAYTLARRARESTSQALEADKARREKAAEAEAARREAIIHRLQELYGDSLHAMHAVRLARRRLRTFAVQGATPESWSLRRKLFEEVYQALSGAALEGERIRQMLKFDGPALDADAAAMQPLESQFGAPFGILDNVLHALDFKGLTAAATSDEALVALPRELVAYADNQTGGNLSFRKGAEQFDKFSAYVLARLRALQTSGGT